MNGMLWIGGGYYKAASLSLSLDLDFILRGEVDDRLVPRILSAVNDKDA